MNLSGNLGSFGLDEVLSLLAMGGRTARMHVTGPHALGVVHLVDGEVSSASSDVRRASLLRQVVAAGEVPVADLAAALESADPVRGLVDAGAVDGERVRGLAHEAVVDALAEMLAWRDGQFAVWTGDEDPGDVGLRVPVAEVLDRARERAGAWSRVREVLPEQEAVLVLAPDLAEPMTLDVEDWSVLARVDGRRTLAEVLAAVGLAPLVASDRVVGLLDRGVLRVRPERVAQPDPVVALLDRYESQGVAAPAPELEEASVLVLVDEAESDVTEVLFDAADLGTATVEVELSAALVQAVPAPLDEDPDPVGYDEDVASVGFADRAEFLGFADGAEPLVLADLDPAASDASGVPVAVSQDAALVEAFESPAAFALAEHVEPAWPADGAVVPFPVAGAAAPDDAEAPVGLADPVEVPVVETPAGPAVQWSPWAQALGLGAPAPEGDLVVDPLAGPGIAEMIAGAHGLSDVEHVLVPPVPIAPETGAVPGPRIPVLDVWPAQEAAEAAPEPAFQPAFADDAVAPVAEAAQGGLLADLMPRGQ
jgi:hypothetical protein